MKKESIILRQWMLVGFQQNFALLEVRGDDHTFEKKFFDTLRGVEAEIATEDVERHALAVIEHLLKVWPKGILLYEPRRALRRAIELGFLDKQYKAVPNPVVKQVWLAEELVEIKQVSMS